MDKVNTYKVGLVFGGMLGIWHVAWATMVFLGLAKPLLDWILGLHFLNFQYSINPFSFSNALILVIITSIIGYVVGYICGWVWNLTHRTSHGR